MNGAARWKKITGHPLFNSLPNTPFASSQELPHDPSPGLTPSLGERLRDVFPGGFESASNSIKRAHLTLSPYHLNDILTRGGNGHVEHTVVQSAWYGKQTKSAAKHEFIVIQVEDLAIPGLVNCLALDRNQHEAGSPTGAPAKLSALSSGMTAVDAFRVSYDGDLKRFLRECQLTPHIELEQIEFHSHKPLLLRDLVALVLYISDAHPLYKALDTNCYWFTGLIWECLREMCPTAKHDIYDTKRRGKIGFVRCVPNPFQVWSVLKEAPISNRPLNLEHFPKQNNPSYNALERKYCLERPVGDDDVGTDGMECLTCHGVSCARR